jgi:hypothetical protein
MILNSIVESCIPGDERIIGRNKVRDVISSYRLTIQVCSLHFLIICYFMFMFFTHVTLLFSLIGPAAEDFSDEQIDAFQCVVDDFFHKWLNLIGYNGITNYMQMLGAGQIKYYLMKWRNLGRFQNQGWEAYNAMITSFWHHHT